MAASVNGNGSTHSTFSRLTGASTRVFETVRFDVSSLSEALDLIKRLGKTGELTVRFHRGSANGHAEFKTQPENNT